MTRVAVTGIGMITALGATAPKSFARLLAGERPFAPLSLVDPTGYRSTLAAEARELYVGNPASEGASSEGSRSDALAIRAAEEAWASAGLRSGDGDYALAMGATVGAMLEAERELEVQDETLGRMRAAGRLLQSHLSRSAERVAERLGPAVPSVVLCSACSSGAAALALGASWLRNGEAERVLAGGCDGLCLLTFAGFNSLGATDPSGCRPFDRQRQGLTLGEGAAFLVLEREETARARGAQVRAWLSGWALGAEAHHLTQPEPSGRRAAGLISEALHRAALTPREVDYVNAHGTGTIHNDAMESLAFTLAFGDQVQRIPISSSKGQLGHTLGAAGAIEAAITVMAIEASIVPPTVGLVEPSPDCSLRHVPGVAEPRPLRAALSTSFGFGGAGAVLAFERADSEPRAGSFQPSSGVVITGSSWLRQPEATEALACLAPDRSRRFDPLTALVTRGAELAVQAADLDAASSGLIVGCAYGPIERSVDFVGRAKRRGPRLVSPAEFPHLVASAASGNASVYSGYQGPVLTVSEVDGCSESAILVAASLLTQGASRALVVGAATAWDRLSRDTRASVFPHLAPPPEPGAAFLVLESAASAESRGARSRARLVQCLKCAPGRHKLPSLAPVPVGACLLFSGDWQDVEPLLAGSDWLSVPRERLEAPEQSLDFRGALALSLSADRLTLRNVPAVGVVCASGGGGGFWALLLAPGAQPAQPPG